MQKLGQLSAHLESLAGISRDQMESFVDLGKLRPTGKDLGQGLEVGRFRYDAVIAIERCPSIIAFTLITSLLLWLDENDPERERYGLEDPDIDVTVEDEQTVFVQLSVEFDESLFIVPDPEGDIAYAGQTWRIADVPIDVAEVLDSMEKA